MADLCKLKENIVLRDAEGQPFIHSLVNGRYYPHHILQASLNRVAKMEVRDDDIWIASFPKSGTHWLWEIVGMLKRQDATVGPHNGTTFFSAVEFSWTDHGALNQESVRRTVVSHLPPRDFPEKFETSGANIFYIYRNPKDVALSYFHHLKNQPFSPYENGTWNAFINWYTRSDKVMYGGHTGHVREWFKTKECLNDRLCFLTFEELKKDPTRTVQKIAEFLEIPLSPDLLAAIVKNTTFNHMRQVKAETRHNMRLFPYLKGEVGDWKNMFTVSQSEAMDCVLQISAKDIPFVYSL